MSKIAEVTWSMRQNQWKRGTNNLQIIAETRVLLAPGYHSRDRCFQDADGRLVRNDEYKTGNKFMDDVKCGELVVVFENGNKSMAMLVRITSEPYMKTIPEITIYHRDNYTNYYGTDEHEVCLTGQRTRKARETDRGEEMVAFVRDIEIVRYVSSDETIFKKYWKCQASIQKNRSLLRFMLL